MKNTIQRKETIMTPREDVQAFQLRLPREIHASLKSLSEEAGISMNDLLVGILNWASEHGFAGEPEHNPADGTIVTLEADKRLWFGSEGDVETDDFGRQYLVKPFLAFTLQYDVPYFHKTNPWDTAPWENDHEG